MTTNETLTPEEQEQYICKALQQQGKHSSEKEIETELYALLLNYHQRSMKDNGAIGLTSYSNPHNIDGLLTISTTEITQRILIEAKTQASLSRTGIWAPLAQALQYTHLLQQLGELLPGVILIATEQEWHAVQVDTLSPLLSRSDLPWETVPSERSPEIENALQELSPTILTYKLEPRLDLNKALEEINTLLQSSNHRATKQHGTSTPAISIDLDPDNHIYHRGDWWRADDENSWSKISPRDLTLFLKEEALSNGAPKAGLSKAIKESLTVGMDTCSVDA